MCDGTSVVTTLDCGPGGIWFKSRVGANIVSGQWRNYRGSSYSRAVGPGRVRGPGPTRINYEHRHSASMN